MHLLLWVNEKIPTQVLVIVDKREKVQNPAQCLACRRVQQVSGPFPLFFKVLCPESGLLGWLNQHRLEEEMGSVICKHVNKVRP